MLSRFVNWDKTRFGKCELQACPTGVPLGKSLPKKTQLPDEETFSETKGDGAH
jgi:hypothetical protein